jgi:hypothetical protein
MRFHFLVVSAVIWILFTGTGYAQTFTGTFGIHDQAFCMNLQSFTATAQIPWSDLTLWTEYRRDWSTDAIFNKTKAKTPSFSITRTRLRLA